MTELLSKLFVKNYDHPEDKKTRERYGIFSSIVGIIVNTLLSLLKLIIGLISSSMAIIADSLNNLSDAGASIVSLVSFKISAKPADRDHPFGHARIEYVASMIVSFLILLVGGELFMQSFSSLFGLSEPATPDFSIASLVILGASIIGKLWLGLFYRNIGKKIDSTVVMASGQDSLNDCISTSAVLVCGIVIKFTDLYIIDAIAGIAVSVLILIAGINILNETKNSILGEGPVEETVNAIKEIVDKYPDAVGIHDMMIHNYGPKNLIASLHVEVDGSKDVYMLHDMIDNIEKHIKNELDIPCTIHMDPIVTNDGIVNELKAFALDAVKSIDQTLSIHDFRAVVGATHTNLIFDVVLPFESKYNEKEITTLIAETILEKRENHFCVITVDRG
jgi:cation diffusion facilitator family transporter